jgi:hypothetical protein
MNYKITVKVLGVETTKTGKTIKEALDKFEMGWMEIKGKGFISAEYGDKKFGRWMNAPQLRRLFNNKITKETWVKRLDNLL